MNSRLPDCCCWLLANTAAAARLIACRILCSAITSPLSQAGSPGRRCPMLFGLRVSFDTHTDSTFPRQSSWGEEGHFREDGESPFSPVSDRLSVEFCRGYK